MFRTAVESGRRVAMMLVATIVCLALGTTAAAADTAAVDPLTVPPAASAVASIGAPPDIIDWCALIRVC